MFQCDGCGKYFKYEPIEISQQDVFEQAQVFLGEGNVLKENCTEAHLCVECAQ